MPKKSTEEKADDALEIKPLIAATIEEMRLEAAALGRLNRELENQKDESYKLTADDQLRMKKAFEAFDTDGSGDLDALELKEIMKTLGFTVTETDMEALVAEVRS